MTGPALTRPQLLSYGLLGVPLAALNLPLYVLLPAFYATDLNLGLATVGVVLLLARLVDVVLDPLIGDGLDRLRHRCSRTTVLVVASPVLLVAAGFLFMPPGDAGALHLLFWSCATYAAWTTILLSYSALGAEITLDRHDRSRVAAAREGCVLVGVVLASALPSILGGEHHALTVLFWFVLLLLPVGLLLLTRLPAPVEVPQEPGPSWRDGLALLLSDRDFRLLLAAFLLNGIANALPATLFLLFVVHVLGEPVEMAGPLLLIYFAVGVAALPFWLRIARRQGKAWAWAASMVLACMAFASVPFLGQGDVWLFGAICVLSGISLGADLALPASIQADVIDADRIRTGRWRSGLYFAFWTMASKLALALSAGIALPLLALGGFRAGLDNLPHALTLLSLLYAALPILFKLAATGLVVRMIRSGQTD